MRKIKLNKSKIFTSLTLATTVLSMVAPATSVVADVTTKASLDINRVIGVPPDQHLDDMFPDAEHPAGGYSVSGGNLNGILRFGKVPNFPFGTTVIKPNFANVFDVLATPVRDKEDAQARVPELSVQDSRAMYGTEVERNAARNQGVIVQLTFSNRKIGEEPGRVFPEGTEIILKQGDIHQCYGVPGVKYNFADPAYGIVEGANHVASLINNPEAAGIRQHPEDQHLAIGGAAATVLSTNNPVAAPAAAAAPVSGNFWKGFGRIVAQKYPLPHPASDAQIAAANGTDTVPATTEGVKVEIPIRSSNSLANALAVNRLEHIQGTATWILAVAPPIA